MRGLKLRGCSGSRKAIVHSRRVDSGDNTGVHTRTSSSSGKLSIEGFKMGKDYGNAGNDGACHRKELGEEEERRS